MDLGTKKNFKGPSKLVRQPLCIAGATDAPEGISLYGFCKEDTGYGIGTQFFKFAFYERKAHAGSQNIVD